MSIPQTPRAKRNVDDIEEGLFDNFPSSLHGTEKGNKSDATLPTLLDPNDLRRLSLSPVSQNGRLTPVGSARGVSPAPRPPVQKERFKEYCKSAWTRNRAPILVIMSQLFGALMNMATRLLELEGEGMHPMQILFVRMSTTVIFSCIYMSCRHVPDAPIGPKGVRRLLVIRGLAGFFGIYGIWYSVMYLPLAEATVISFLAPNLAGYFCHVFIHEPFTRTEQLASFLALGGVILIARPDSLFSGNASDSQAATAAVSAAAMSNTTDTATTSVVPRDLDHVATTSERLSAIAMALVGVLGSSVTIVVLRKIGERAHPLISVNYFSTWCTLVTTVALSVAPALDYDQPSLRFALPQSLRQWGLLALISACGFLTQFTLTAGLSGESSNRATAMIYTQMLFAAAFDRFVFGHEMGWASLVGCGLIVGGSVWVALSKRGDDDRDGRIGDGPVGDVEGGHGRVGGAEGVPMLGGVDPPEEEDVEELVPMERLSLR